MPARIKTDDEVIVIGGKDKGKTGKVLRVDPKKDRCYIEGLNMIKRHTKPNQATAMAQQQSGVIEREGPIHLSNVALLDPKDNRPTRVRIQIVEGKRHRVAVRSGQRID
jgi:large subunit ribosomal protein L24